MKNKLLYAAAVIGALVGIYGGLATFGINLPRPTWHHEHQELAALSLDHVLVQLNRRLIEIDIAIAKFRREGIVPPENLIRERQHC